MTSIIFNWTEILHFEKKTYCKNDSNVNRRENGSHADCTKRAKVTFQAFIQKVNYWDKKYNWNFFLHKDHFTGKRVKNHANLETCKHGYLNVKHFRLRIHTLKAFHFLHFIKMMKFIVQITLPAHIILSTLWRITHHVHLLSFWW